MKSNKSKTEPKPLSDSIINEERNLPGKKDSDDELHRLSVRNAFRVLLMDSLRQLSGANEIKSTAVRILGQYLKANRVAYAEVTSEGDVIIENGYADGVKDIPGRYRLDDYGTVLLDKIKKGINIVVTDVENDPTYSEEEKTRYRLVQVVANLNVPLIKNGQPVALLAVHQANSRNWTDDEVSLVEETVEMTWSTVERARVEEALRLSEERFRLALKNSPVSVAMQDSNLVYQWAYNQRTRKPWEIIGRTDFDLFAPEDIEGILSAKRKVLETGKEIHVQQWVTSNGKKVFLDLYYEPTRDATGQITGIGITVVDLTEQKLAGEALRLSEERLNITLNSIGDAVITTDSEGIVTFLNPVATALSGWKLKDAIGQPIWKVFSIINEQTQNPAEDIVNRVLLEGRVIELANHTALITRKGHQIPIEDSAAPIKDRDGKTLGVVVVFHDVTQKRRNEETRRLLASIVESSDDAILSMDVNGTILTWNASAEVMFGYFSHEIVGQSITKILPDDRLNEEDQVMERLKNGERIKHFETVRIAKDGRRLDVSITFSLLRDSSGKIIGTSKIIRDITEIKRDQLSLQEGQLKLRRFYESGLIGVFYWNIEGIITDANNKFLEMLGYSRNDLITGKIDWVNMTPPEFHHLDEISVTELKTTGVNKVPFEKEYYRKDGTRIPIIIAGAMLDTERFNGVAFVLDISSRKKYEYELIEAKEKLNLALENGNIGIWEWDLKTDVVVWDPRMEKMFGLKPGTFHKTYDEFESLIHEEDLSHFRKAINETLSNNLPFETVFRTRPEKGITKHISSKALLNRDREGNPESFTGVCFDVTAMKEGTENIILKLNEELLRSNKELESFAYVASHDLQEPLRMVSSFTQLLEKQYKDKLDDKALEYIHFAVDGSKRMFDLLNGLLAYSRIQTKGKEFNRVELTKVLEAARQNLALTIKERNAVIKSDDLPVVTGDMVQLIQLVQNLLGNAIKFSIESPRIYFSSKSNQDHYLISIKDEGMGIEPQYFDKIFEIFQRLNPRDQYEGTGIGLAICKRIVERHGGRIWVESEYGKGSTFNIIIPKTYSE